MPAAKFHPGMWQKIGIPDIFKVSADIPDMVAVRAERKAKSYAVGRKAFLFHTSEAGAGASAVMYSIVETAKANNLNIFQYLYMVLLYMPDYMNSSAGIEQLMPWSEFIKEQCSGIIDVESNVPENRIPLPCR